MSSNNTPGNNTPWWVAHLEKLLAAAIALLGLVAVIYGRDSYVVGIIGTSLGYLFGYGRGTLKGGS